MIPITRKELYLNKIVGNDDYDTPEKPITPEEFFFAAILGEAVQTPEPLSRYQIYLAKIAGRNISVPKPLTRLELFLAKACGMDIETPTPITREEVFWSNYSAIVEFEVEGVPPLTYKAIEGTLENYRIYGNTVGGESVGDRTGNLFDKDSNMNTHGTIGSLSIEPLTYGFPGSINEQSGTYFMDVLPGEVYTISMETTGDRLSISGLYHPINPNDYTPANRVVMDTIITVMITGENVPDTYTFTVPPNVVMVAIYYALTSMPTNFQIVKGSTALPYEPYGYKVPVTVSNGTDTLTTPIYLSVQIRKVGDEAEYIDYAEQKQYFADGTETDVTLPALPTLTGTNVLSVGTAVQPSKVYIKGEKEREYS